MRTTGLAINGAGDGFGRPGAPMLLSRPRVPPPLSIADPHALSGGSSDELLPARTDAPRSGQDDDDNDDEDDDEVVVVKVVVLVVVEKEEEDVDEEVEEDVRAVAVRGERSRGGKCSASRTPSPNSCSLSALVACRSLKFVPPNAKSLSFEPETGKQSLGILGVIVAAVVTTSANAGAASSAGSPQGD